MGGPSLPYRPTPIEGESWPGYLLRLANSNGLRGLTRLSELLGVSKERLLRANIYAVGASLRLPHLRDIDGFDDGSGYRGYLKMRTRVCPQCLGVDEIPYIRASWDSPIKLHCKEHRKFLLDACPDCCRKLSYSRGWIDKCPCGSQMSGWKSASSEAWMRDLYELVGASRTVDRPRLTFSLTSKEEILQADLLLRVARMHREIKSSTSASRSPRFKFVAASDLDVLREVFGFVPDSVESFFSNLKISGISSQDIIFSRNSELLNIWQRTHNDSVRAKTVPRPAPWHPPPGFVSKKRLMKELGLHPTAVDYLIETRVLKGVVRFGPRPDTDGAFHIPESEYLELVKLYKSTMSIDVAADSMFLRASTIRILGYSGCVPTVHLGKCKYVFRLYSSDVIDLTSSVFCQATRFTRLFETLMSFEDAISDSYRFDAHLAKRLLNEMREGGLRGWIVSRSATHLGEIHLKSEDYDQWINANRPNGARRVNKIPG